MLRLVIYGIYWGILEKNADWESYLSENSVGG
jgi:hypothetical protein